MRITDKKYEVAFNKNDVCLRASDVKKEVDKYSDEKINELKCLLFESIVEHLKSHKSCLSLGEGKIYYHEVYDPGSKKMLSYYLLYTLKNQQKVIGVYYVNINMYDFNKSSLEDLKNLHFEIINILRK